MPLPCGVDVLGVLDVLGVGVLGHEVAQPSQLRVAPSLALLVVGPRPGSVDEGRHLDHGVARRGQQLLGELGCPSRVEACWYDDSVTWAPSWEPAAVPPGGAQGADEPDAGLGQVAFLRVAPPRPRRVTPDSLRMRCTKP